MENVIAIGAKPAEGASASDPHAPQIEEHGANVLAAPPDGLLVTEPAVAQIRAVLAKEGIPLAEGGLRLGVKGGGCSGLSYSIATAAGPRDNDRIFPFGDVRVFIDPRSFIYLRGVTLDYEQTLIRQGFHFINPNSKRSCGCGSSFSV